MSSHTLNRKIGVLAGLACLPIYIGPAAPIINIPGVFGSAQPVHWSLLWAPVLFVATRKARIRNSEPLMQTGVALLVWLLVALLIGQFFAEEGTILAVSFYLQLLIPSLLLAVGSALGQTEDLWVTTSQVMLKGLATFQVLFCVINAGLILSGNPRDIAEVFPQFQTYYPGLLALGLCLSVFLWPQLRLWTLIYLGTIAFLAPVIWSRIGLTVILLGGLASLAVKAKTGGGRKPSTASFFGFVIGGVAAAIAAFMFVRETLSGAIGERLEDKGGDVLESGRQELMLRALRIILDKPLLGDAGQALYDRADFGGTGGVGLRLFPAHSQILDLGIRGGVPAIVLGLLLVWILLRMSRRAYTSSSSGAHRLLPAVALVMVAASVSDLYFSQGLTAAPGWLLIGLGVGGLSRISGHSPDDDLDATAVTPDAARGLHLATSPPLPARSRLNR